MANGERANERPASDRISEQPYSYWNIVARTFDAPGNGCRMVKANKRTLCALPSRCLETAAVGGEGCGLLSHEKHVQRPKYRRNPLVSVQEERADFGGFGSSSTDRPFSTPPNNQYFHQNRNIYSTIKNSIFITNNDQNTNKPVPVPCKYVTSR